MCITWNIQQQNTVFLMTKLERSPLEASLGGCLTLALSLWHLLLKCRCMFSHANKATLNGIELLVMFHVFTWANCTHLMCHFLLPCKALWAAFLVTKCAIQIKCIIIIINTTRKDVFIFISLKIDWFWQQNFDLVAVEVFWVKCHLVLVVCQSSKMF